MTAREIIEGLSPKKKHSDFRVGDLLRVHVRIREGEKERIQVFEGTVIKKRRGGESASFTVRKVSYGVGVERIFPFQSSMIEKIEVMQRGKVRRARLYYLRDRQGKERNVAEATTPEAPSETSIPKENTKEKMKVSASESQTRTVL